MLLRLSFTSAFISSLAFLAQVAAFSYKFNTPSECDDLALSWTGGTGPFKLLIIPVFGTPSEVSIPDSAFKDGKGSYSTQLALPKGQKVIFSMSDSTGFNSGGATEVLTVAASKGGSCNTTIPATGFFFQLNSALQQCRPFVFDGYDGATQPVTINVIIPGGSGVEVKPPTGPTSYPWTANAAAGTSMIFLMTDSRGRSGGSSDVRIVGISDDSSCLNNNSPSSTSNPPSNTGKSSSTGDPSGTSSPSSSSGVSAGAIAGGIIGGVLFLAVIITLVLFYLKKKRNTHGGAYGKPNKQTIEELDSPGAPNQPLYPAPTTPYAYTPSTAQMPYHDNPSANPLLQQTPGEHQHQGFSANQYGQGANNQFVQAQTQPPTNYQYQPSSQYPPAGAQYPPSGYQNAPVPYRDQAGQPIDRPVSQSMFSDSAGSSSQYDSTLPYLRTSVAGSTALYPPAAGPQAGVAGSSRPSGTSNAGSSDYDPYAGTAGHAPPTSQTSSAQRKAAMAGPSNPGPSRFILHTDAEDAFPPPQEEEVVELPPQYTERRGGPIRLDPPTGLPAGTPHKS